MNNSLKFTTMKCNHSIKAAFGLLLSLMTILYASLLTGCSSDPGFRPTISGQKYPSSAGTTIKYPASDSGHLTVTIGLYTLGDRVSAANTLKSNAVTVLPGYDIWLSNDDAGLSVNCGRFKSNSDAEIALAKVKSVYSQMNPGRYQFPFIKDIPQQDPQIPANWYLLNNQCFYTLEIGGYYNVPEKSYYDRKIDAVKAVEALRKDGEQAFLIHGRFESRIYVGCFGPQEVQRGFDANNHPQYQFSASVQRLQKKYPYRFEHGNRVYEYVMENGKKVKKPWRSTIVPIDILMEGINF